MTLVGVLGGGQLGRMLALAGYPLGFRFRVFDPAERPSAGDVATHACGFYDDPAAVARFAAGLDLCTYEFENVPVETAELVGRSVPLHPSARALACTQDRLAERELLRGLGVPVAAYAIVDRLEDLSRALDVTGLPAILKRRRLGYDGHGQAVIRSMCESVQASAWRRIGGGPAIVETLVPFARELALISVRARRGETRFYPLVETRHRDGILRSATAPATATPRLRAQAEDYASRILDALHYVGVLTIEFFEHEGALIVNEIAPRVHNSGHWTIEGAETSQFENHLRAIAGLPLGSTAPVGCAALVNLIGVPPDPAAVLRLPDTHIHLYGKPARPGRKIGHVTVRAADRGALARRLEDLRRIMPPGTEGDIPCDS